jgi:hypothetical protein
MKRGIFSAFAQHPAFRCGRLIVPRINQVVTKNLDQLGKWQQIRGQIMPGASRAISRVAVVVVHTLQQHDPNNKKHGFSAYFAHSSKFTAKFIVST